MKKEKYNVTGMTCSACSSRVEKCVSKMAAVEEVSVNLLANKMQVSYDDSQISSDDIMKEVEKAGYGASLIKNKALSGGQISSSDMERKYGGQGAIDGDRASDSSGDSNGNNNGNPQITAQLKEMQHRFLWSLAFLVPLMYISMGHMLSWPLPGWLSGHENAVSFAFTQFLFCIPVVYLNRGYYTRGFKSLAHGAPNMDSLIAVGSSAALIYGIFAIYRMSYGLGIGDMELVAKYHMELYFESAVMILTLITLGKYLETRSKGKTGQAIEKLMNLAPKTAIIFVDGAEQEIPVEYVKTGDILVIKAGGQIPVDGIVVEGNGSVDESAITGESIPVEKLEGMTLTGATILTNGYVKMEATRVGEDTTFSQIIRLVEEASATKAPIAKMADKIAGIFVPVVMTIAFITAVVWLFMGHGFEFALSNAICVLVISCPCALGLATPVAIMVGTGKGAENGILIRSGEALEIAHHVDTVVFDKTGTITQGKPVVTDVLPVTENQNEQELLIMAAALEQKSEHPLASAVVSYAEELKIHPDQVNDFVNHPGMGIEGMIGQEKCFAGNEKLMKEYGIDVSTVEKQKDQLASDGKTPLYFAKEGKLCGVIAVADVVKSTSKNAIDGLNKMGIDVVMLTGDNEKTAQGIGKNLNLSKIIADVLPQEKEKVIAELQEEGKTVAMVGDGINDAPALVRADVGIAIGAGTDVAIDSADLILMRDDLRDVTSAITLSKAVIRNIKENLFWAFFYNCLGIPLAAGVFYPLLGWRLNPMFGAAAMSFSSVFVVTNALRLRFLKLRDSKNVISAKENVDTKEMNCIQENTDTKEMNHVQENVHTKDMDQTQENAKNGKIEIDNKELLPDENHQIKAKKASDEFLPENINNDNKEEQKMMTFHVEGMMCKNCVRHVKEALEAFAGVSADVNLEAKTAVVTGGEASSEALKKAIEDAGYDVSGVEA